MDTIVVIKGNIYHKIAITLIIVVYNDGLQWLFCFLKDYIGLLSSGYSDYYGYGG